MELRGMFKTIFGGGSQNKEYSNYKLLNSWESQFVPFNGNAWEINAVRAAVDSFARSAAKVSPRHICHKNGVISDIDSNLNRLLQCSPNAHMSAYAFYYKVAAQYMMSNNAFIYPVVSNGRITALYPINASGIELLEYQGEMYVRLKFTGGTNYICPYSDIIHIRRHFNDNDLYGSSNKPIIPVLQTANTFNQSMSKFAELIAVVRGILKVSGTPKDEDLRKQRDRFIENNLKMDNNGAGIVVTDNKYEYTNIDSKQTPIPTGQLDYIRREIFDYFGTNESIVQNKATPDEWNSFYEGQLEPFFIQMSQAFTSRIFTDKERGFGNEIMFESNRMQYASLSDKVTAAKFLTDIGAATLDNVLEIFNMAPIGGDEGKRRVQTLNMVNAEKADDYQLGKKDDKFDETE